MNLKSLILNDNHIKNIPETLCDLPNLETLNLKNCSLTTFPVKHIYKLKKLRKIDLSYNNFDRNTMSIILYHLSQLPFLEIIEIYDFCGYNKQCILDIPKSLSTKQNLKYILVNTNTKINGSQNKVQRVHLKSLSM